MQAVLAAEWKWINKNQENIRRKLQKIINLKKMKSLEETHPMVKGMMLFCYLEK